MGQFSIQVERENKYQVWERIRWILDSEECLNLTGEQKRILIKGVGDYPKQIQKFPIDGEYEWTPMGSVPRLKKRKHK